ncbi:hypothetical protein [Neobacillus mesonae]|uniref:hypothetical protein n=1 Tax=Neobacillus mesonae TaxID=1193713 RepID=UPI00203E01F7|nr:hypothetical protein [Neobacillus mesonae]MCM3569412.1 hypothetical protein [Neobacillus mesonae]
MRYFKEYGLLIIFILLLTGCTGVEKEEPSSSREITIESYTMSEKEKLLISKTGVGQIEFFKVNGALKEEDLLQFSVEEFKNGKFEKELQKSSDGPKTVKFKDSLISFGISGIEEVEGHTLKLLTGVPSGLVTTDYSNHMTMSTFSRLIDKKVSLEKNKPVYLAAWAGTTQNTLRSVESENGELPAGIEDAETALLYKVLWTDKEMK